MVSLLVVATAMTGCGRIDLGAFEDGDGGETPPPYAVNYSSRVPTIEATNARGVFADVTWTVPSDTEWRLEGPMQLRTDDARVMAVDRATVTNMTANASVDRLRVDRAAFTVVPGEVRVDPGQPAADVAFARGLALRGDVQTPRYDGSGEIRGSNVTLHADPLPVFAFHERSKVTVPEATDRQATGIQVPTADPADPLAVDDRRIPVPWEAWFTELDLRIPADAGEEIRLEGGIVQAVEEGSPVFDCRLVLDASPEAASLGRVHVEGSGSSFLTRLVVEHGDGTRNETELDFLDIPHPRGVRGQLLPGETYPVPRDEGASVDRWQILAPNCAVDDRR